MIPIVQGREVNKLLNKLAGAPKGFLVSKAGGELLSKCRLVVSQLNPDDLGAFDAQVEIMKAAF